MGETEGPGAADLTRRTFLAAGAVTAGGWLGARRHPWLSQGARPTPSAAQLAWQRDELAIFLHFGVNTFTDREWGDGGENPAIFDPAHLDARQWARAARAAGFRAMILTAKHHDGFCLWPSRTTSHSVASSPWRGGDGDLVGEFVEACRAENLRPGLYLSPWDRHEPVYGDSPRYNDLYCDQMTELLTRYGPIAEVWFDGANGEGPNGRRQVYDWPRFFGLVRRLQPDAVMFSDAGPDVRWCGNERGVAGDPNWSTVDPEVVPYPGASGDRVTTMLQHGDPYGTVWRPAETNTSIRPGWFYHPAEDDRVRTVDDLVELYFTSVGRNSKLLLNIPPTREGLLHQADVARIKAFHDGISGVLAEDLAADAEVEWRVSSAGTAEAVIDLPQTVTAEIARLEEPIERGQAVAAHTLSVSDGGPWQVLERGSTVGYARLVRFPPTQVRRIKLTVDQAVAAPEQVHLRLYGSGA